MNRVAYFISNRTAITAETLGHSLLAQFENQSFDKITIPFVDSVEKAERVTQQITDSYLKTGVKPIVISTLIDLEIISIVNKAKALVLDSFELFLPALEKELSTHHQFPQQVSHRIRDEKSYDARISAVDFSLLHDDGLRAKHYEDTDVILIGVSRSGKTPTSLYMALQFGLKAANYPITEEDMEQSHLPKSLIPHLSKCFGLTTEVTRLHHIRQERLPNSRYASLDQCKFEIKAVEAMFDHHKIPFINTSSMSVEEIATKIVAKEGLHRV